MSSGPVFQNSVYVGINLEDILYGVELALYFRTMRVLLFRKGGPTKIDIGYAIFSSVMVLMLTLYVSTQAVFGEKMWLEDANFPGGPDAFWASNASIWYMDLGTTAVVVLQLLTDALMTYRCRLICDSYRVIILPSMLWFATLVLGIVVTWMSSVGGNFFQGIGADLGIAYYTTSVALTAMLTVTICHRMVTHGRMVQRQLGEDYASVYFALLGAIVESVLPYTLSGIAFLASLGVNSPTSVGFMSVYLMLMCISPQMVILRVASGLAWNEETGKVLPSTLKFSYGGHSTSGEESRAVEGTDADREKETA